MTKIKLNKNELSEMVKRSIKKVLKEDFNDSPYPEDIEFDSNVENDEMENVSVDDVLKSYLETLIWSSGEELDGYSINDIDANSINKSKEDIYKFIELVKDNPEAIEEMNSYDEKSFGHNLALSRNGHGAGFFDEYNDTLQDLARNFGEADLYVGDDNKLYIMGSEMSENKIKLKKNELTEMIKKSIKKVLKEDWYDGFSDTQYDDAQQSHVNKMGGRDINDESEEFIPHGSYTVSNSGGYEVMLSNDGDMAKVRDAFGGENPQVSDWLPIEYVYSGGYDDENDENDDYIPVIDPDGYNIPLNQVMRINNFNESKKVNTIKIKISELKNIIKQVVSEDTNK